MGWNNSPYSEVQRESERGNFLRATGSVQVLKSKSSPKLGVGSPPTAGSGTVANFRIKMEGEPGEPQLSMWFCPRNSERSAQRDPGSKRRREGIGKISAEPQSPAGAGWGGGGRGARPAVTTVSVPGSLAACAGCGPGPLGVKRSRRPAPKIRGAGREPRARACYYPHFWGYTEAWGAQPLLLFHLSLRTVWSGGLRRQS